MQTTIDQNAPRIQNLKPPTTGTQPGPRPAGPTPQNDKVQLSGEPPENEAADHIAALRDNYGEPEGPGPIDLVNHSAPVEKDCAEILAALGEAVPGDIDLATNVVGTPIGGGRLNGTVTGSLAMNGEIPALASLDAHIGEAQTNYKGALPPKVARHVELARAAAQKAGLR